MSHVDKRNADYINIASSIRFQVDRVKLSILDHQFVYFIMNHDEFNINFLSSEIFFGLVI